MGKPRTDRVESNQQGLVESLVGDLTPVQPIGLTAAYALALMLQALAVVGGSLWLGVDVGSLNRLYEGPFAGLCLALAGAGALCAIAAAKLALPGRHVSEAGSGGLATFPVLLILGIVVIAPWGGQWAGLIPHAVGGAACTRSILMIALPTWLATLVLLRRLAPLSPAKIGFFAGLSSLLMGAFVLQLACPVTDAYHLAVSHYAPVPLAALLASALSGVALR